MSGKHKEIPVRMPGEQHEWRACEDVGERTHELLLELWATDTLLRLGQIAWSPTLKAYAADLAETKQNLISELSAIRAR
jgi:hypothetical protein